MATLTKGNTEPLQLNEAQAFFGRLLTVIDHTDVDNPVHRKEAVQGDGFALTNLGRIHQTDRFEFPHNNANVLLEPTWTTTPNSALNFGGGTVFSESATLISTDNVDIDFTTSNMEVDITIHSSPFAGEGLVPEIFLVSKNSSGVVQNQNVILASRILDETGTRIPAITTPGNYTLVSLERTVPGPTIPADEDLALVTRIETTANRDTDYTIHAVRVSYNTFELAATGAYPPTGGFATENLGSTTFSLSGLHSAWPATFPVIKAGDLGLTYTPGAGGIATGRNSAAITAVGGQLQNTSGADITLPANAYLEVELYFDELPVGGLTFDGVTLAGTATSGQQAGSFADIYSTGQFTLTEDGIVTARLVAGSQADTGYTWGNGVILYLALVDTPASNQTGFTFTINAVRVSTTNTPYRRQLTERLSYYNRGGVVPTNGSSQVYTRTDFHIRSSTNGVRTRGANGADSTANSTTGTWGAYPARSSYTSASNPGSIDLDAFPLTVGDQIDLVFNRNNNAGDSIESTFTAFREDDLMRIERTGGSSNVGNGYVFELHEAPVLNDQDADGRNIVLIMSGVVREVLGTGQLEDSLNNPERSDTVTVTRRGAGSEVNTGISNSGTTVQLSTLRGVDDGRN